GGGGGRGGRGGGGGGRGEGGGGGKRARHASAVRVRLLRCASRVEALRHGILEIGMRDVDFGIDHGDRHVGAADQAVDVGNLELLQHVLRGISLPRVPARCRHWIA